MRRWILGLMFALPACGARPPIVHDTTIALRAPGNIPEDLTVRQHLAVVATTDTGEKEGSFDAVLQKHGEELLVVGLGPAGVRAFVLRQTAAGVTLDQRFGPPLPFAPERVVQDIHRVFFRRAAPPPKGEGEAHAAVDGDAIVENWVGGHLAVRRIVGQDGEQVVVRFGHGCSVETCRPEQVTLTSGTRKYTLTITNEEFQE